MLGKFAKEFMTSLATVITAILAIAIFIYSGATALFYAVVAAAFIVGFYNTWLISVSESGAAQGQQGPRRQGRRR